MVLRSNDPADTLPNFPGPRWEPDVPVRQEVANRAKEILPELWVLGEGTVRQEKIAGRWITFQAALHEGGKHGVNAWRVKAP